MGLTNTLLVAAIGIVLATLLGFVIGMARLSSNWLVAKLATVYVEIVRNMPLLLQLLAWYFTLLDLAAAPAGERAPAAGDRSHQPRALSAGADLAAGHGSRSRGACSPGSPARWRSASGPSASGSRRAEQVPAFWYGAAAVVVPPLLMFLALGLPLSFEVAQLGRFNFEGGIVLLPELMALLLGLTLYTAAFIAEIVRSGIEAVPRGQKEAAPRSVCAPGRSSASSSSRRPCAS